MLRAHNVTLKQSEALANCELVSAGVRQLAALFALPLPFPHFLSLPSPLPFPLLPSPPPFEVCLHCGYRGSGGVLKLPQRKFESF